MIQLFKESPYAERDKVSLELSGAPYTAHKAAMKTFGLRRKSDIAAELAYRDLCLSTHALQNQRLTAELNALRMEFHALQRKLYMVTLQRDHPELSWLKISQHMGNYDQQHRLVQEAFDDAKGGIHGDQK